jgi:hypothetical protein
MDGVPIIEVALRFTPAESAALPNGTGLVQGTCARADRPLRVEEPALIRFTMLLGDSTGTSPSWSSGGGLLVWLAGRLSAWQLVRSAILKSPCGATRAGSGAASSQSGEACSRTGPA